MIDLLLSGLSAMHNYEGSYRLEADMSWTAVDEISVVDEERED